LRKLRELCYQFPEPDFKKSWFEWKGIEMPRKYTGDFQPSIKRYGWTTSISLVTPPTAAAANAVCVFTVPPTWVTSPRSGNPAFVLTDVQYIMQSLGVGGASGSWTWKIRHTRTGVFADTSIFAYNATTLTDVNDVRDASGMGYKILVGDTLALDLTGIPGGTITTGAIVHVILTGLCFGARG